MSLDIKSQVIITQDSTQVVESLKAKAKDYRVIIIQEESKAFSVDDAKEAIAKAYIASEIPTLIILIAKIFSPIVQSKLLKIIEEPPPKTDFILITQSKSTILPTIKSRLPIATLYNSNEEQLDSIDVISLNLQSVYDFIQKHKRTSAKEVKIIIEQITKDTIKSNLYNIDQKTLNIFSEAIKVLDMGSPASFVLSAVLIKLLAKKKKPNR
jgi:DNA polymerase-3 subunit delta'